MWLSRRCGLRNPQRGATMVEFAFTAVPFLLLLFGTLELGLIFVAYYCVSNATLQIARQVRVGQIVLPGASVTNTSGTQMGLSAFKAAICKNVPILTNSSCLTQIQVDVRTQTGFQSQSAPNPLVAKDFNTSGFCFYSGLPGNIVSVRVYLLWPIVTPAFLSGLVNATSMTTSSGTTSGGFFVMTSSEVFKNEPNSTATNTGNGC